MKLSAAIFAAACWMVEVPPPASKFLTKLRVFAFQKSPAGLPSLARTT